MNTNQYSLKPGEIRLDYIPVDWPLTPLGANKDPYVVGWQAKPFSVTEIEEELTTGKCKAIGLLGGPVYNHPYGLIWVDVDGPSVYKLVEELAGVPFKDALPPTLTVFSGKEGRERRLYKLDRDSHKHIIRNKYTWHGEENKEKLEILWKRHQGVLMGLHPETDGYYTVEGHGFEWVQNLPQFPAWILNAIINKNVKQGKPATETTRMAGANFAIQAQVGLDRDIQVAREAMWAMPPEAADDYDIWITVGQSLHSLDESLLDEWDNWSKQSEKYRDGECHRRWLSFSRGGGRTLGSLIHIAQENGWQPSQDHKVMPVDDATLEHVSALIEKIENDLGQTTMALAEKPRTSRTTDTWNTQPRSSFDNKGKKSDQDNNRSRNPSSDLVADTVLTMYTGDLRYSQPHGQFFLYNKRKGLWEPLTKVEMLGDIRSKLKVLVASEFLPKGFSTNLMNDVYTQLQSEVPFDDWYDGSDYLLFTNGVLDINSKELLPFDRNLHLIQQMPYEYDPGATCEDIVKWLKHTQHNSWNRTQVLRAWLRATLLGRYEIQKFVEIVGPGKSGKSTYANLAVALVGKQNTYSTDFENLEKNRFEAASYMGKKLLLFQDADRWGGSVSKLKAITGNDWIRSERKYQTESQDPFQYHGMVMITANEAIQSTDYTSGLARRRLTIPFDRPFEGGQAEQKELIKFDTKGNPQGVFAPLLSGLVNWLLDMTEEDMRSYLMETGKNVSFFQKYEKTQSLRSNPMLDWMEHKIVFDPGVSSPVGFCKAQPAGGSGYYMNWSEWLYASYAEFSRSCNVGIMSRGRFEPLFLDICKHQLKLNVYGIKSNKGMRIVNAAVRESNKTKYEGYPSIVEVAAKPDEYQQFYGSVLTTSTDAIMDENAIDM
jgi:phage/plasmid-associated DNA primase